MWGQGVGIEIRGCRDIWSRGVVVEGSRVWFCWGRRGPGYVDTRCSGAVLQHCL